MKMRGFLNKMVRFYLMRFPITEGKKQLLNMTRNLIFPHDHLFHFKTKYNFHFKVNLNNPEHQQIYFYGEHDERYEISTIRKMIKKGDVCWDIGANIGFYTCLFASLVEKCGKVVAFEPAAKSMEFLETSVAMNRFENVLPVRKALGDKKEEKRLFCSSKNLAEGTATLKPSEGQNDFEVVEVDKIDNLFERLPSPDFIKIDVERNLMEVFEGGEKFFRNHNPLIMAELEGDIHIIKRMESFLRNSGYNRSYEFKKRGLRFCAIGAGGRNFMLVKDPSQYLSRIQNLIL